jgi:hypothetical protein
LTTCQHPEKEHAVERQPVFLNCPAYLDNDGATRCGLPAEVETQYAIRSTDGPLESAKIRCPRGHWFNGPIESLTIPTQPAAVSASLLAPPMISRAMGQPPAEPAERLAN